MWKSEGIVFPQKANNIQNYLACFCNYMQEEVVKMSNIKIFFVFFPVG